MISSQAPSTARLPGWLGALMLLLVLPLALRLRPIEHGRPRNYLPDTHVVRSALGMAKDKDLVPEVGTYSSYPNLVPYMLLPIYAGQYFLGSMNGRWADSEAFGDHVLEHPESVHITARYLVAVLGALSVWVAFLAARAWGLGSGAWIAAWLVATSVLHTHFSIQERPWVPMVFFMLLAAWPAALYERGRGARYLYLSALAAGLAFACHQAGLLAFGIPGAAWLFAPTAWRGSGLRRRVLEGALCVLCFFAIALLLGHPYLLVHGRTAAEQAVMGTAVDQLGGFQFGGQAFHYKFSLDAIVIQARSLVGYELPLVLLAPVGLFLALRRRGTRGLALFIVCWGLLFFTNFNHHVRYLLPLATLCALPAGLFAETWLRQRAGVLTLLPLLALPLVMSLRLGSVLVRADMRQEAEEHLFELGWDTLVVIDRYGPQVPLDRTSLERLAQLRQLRGWSLTAREFHRLEVLEDGRVGPEWGGVKALPVEDILLLEVEQGTFRVHPELESLGADPQELFAQLGVTHFLLVSREPRNIEQHTLYPLVAGREPVWTLDPSLGETAKETRLPIEMNFALGGLTAVERPGPWMALYDLR